MRSGNGLGDSNQGHSYIPLLEAFDASIDPPYAATIRDAFECDGGLRLLLGVHSEKDFELVALADGHRDRWHVRVAESCPAIPGCID